MIVKEIHFGDDGQKKLKSGIKKIAGAVKSTMGARGRTVLIESENHIGGITVTKDGVTVAMSINLYDPTENLAVMMMRQAADRTAVVAGDGTTTAIVLAESIIDNSDNIIDSSDNITEVIREINDISNKISQRLTKMSKKLSGKKLLDVATISANNDREIGKMISDAFNEVSVVTVENSQTPNTHVEIISGMKIDRGFSSKYFITDQKKQECILENPYVLITDHDISNILNIEKVIAHVISTNRSLLIIGELSPSALNTLNLNVIQGKIKACNIMPPSFGYRSKDLLFDLSVSLGGTYFSEDTGDDLSLVEVEDLGRASRVIVSKDMTLFMPMDDTADAVKKNIDILKESINETNDINEKNFINERIANMSGGIGVIYVGALSDIEQKEKKDRIDDAVCAVKAALEDGVLPGGGIALMDAFDVEFPDVSTTAQKIMMTVVSSPFRQIVNNAGKDSNLILENMPLGRNIGYDVKTESYGDMISLGIIDPTKVTRNALMNAVSVATTIMSTDAIITNVRDYESSK